MPKARLRSWQPSIGTTTHQQGKIPVSEGILSGTVPGVVDAWYMLLDRWGTMTFAEVLAPAIEMAANGFVLNERLAASLKSEKLRKYPTSVQAFSLDRTWEAGAIYTVPQLARTLSRLVEAEQEATAGGRRAALKAARDRFYKGDIAHEMAEFSEQQGGLFRYEDFATYGAIVDEPVSIDYRGYQVLKDRSANQGPAELFALNILETFDLQALQHNSAEYIHAGAESIKLAFADREYLGDDRFIKIPWETLLSKEYAAQRRRLIDPDKACFEFRQGEIESYAHPADIDYARPGGDGGDTSYLCIIDQDRNVVSFTPSLHTGYGTCVAMGELGFTLNCRGDYFSLVPGHPNALAPGKRPRSTLQSTLVLKNGKPFLVMGSPGGDDQCLRTLQTFLERSRVWHERSAGDRGAALVHSQFSAVRFSAHDVSWRGERGGPNSRGCTRSAAQERPQAQRDRRLVTRLHRGNRRRPRNGRLECRRGSESRCVRGRMVRDAACRQGV